MDFPPFVIVYHKQTKSPIHAEPKHEEVHRFFGDGVSLILDGGQTPGGMSSTVVGVDHGKLQLIRAGVIDFSSLIEVSKVDA